MAHSKTWFRFYNRMPDSPQILELDDAEFRLLIRLWCLASEADDGGVIPYTIKALSKLFGLSSDSLRTLFRHFSDISLICERDGSFVVQNWDKHQYGFVSKTPRAMAQQKANERDRKRETVSNVGTVSERCRNGVGSDVGTVSEACRKRESESEYVQTSTPYTPQNTDLAHPPSAVEPTRKTSRKRKNDPLTMSLGFDAVWEEYPRHEAKQKAIQAWSKLNPSDDLRELILERIRLMKKTAAWTALRHSADGRDTVPYFSSWINGRRWEDELAPPPGHSAGGNGVSDVQRSMLPSDVQELGVRMAEFRRKKAAGEPLNCAPPASVQQLLDRIAAERAEKERVQAEKDAEREARWKASEAGA